MSRAIKIILPLTVLGFILCEYVLFRECVIARKLYATLLSFQWRALAAVAVCLCALILFEFEIADLAIVGLVLIAGAWPLFSLEHRIGLNAVTFVFGAAMGKAIRLIFARKAWQEKLTPDAQIRNQSNPRHSTALLHSSGDKYYFLAGLSALLAIASFCQLHLLNAYYNGPRWRGIWDNPNEYGMLMGSGIVLAAGLLATKETQQGKAKKWLAVMLFIATGMMAVGLLFSYSRGAWLGTAVGLAYLAKVYRKIDWRYALPCVIGIAAVVWIFWNRTSDSAPWYLKRIDFGRASAQHRVAAWKAGLEIMRDHPFGVGWNKPVEVYFANYSPPQGGAGAISTNDYLMLGTQLGLPGLVCFLVYVATCFRGSKSQVPLAKEESQSDSQMHRPKSVTDSRIESSALDGSQLACRAGALSMLVAFWFDDGLFNLATAVVFWILLELGRAGCIQIRRAIQSPIDLEKRREITSAS